MGKTIMGEKRLLENRWKRFLAVGLVVAFIFGVGGGASAFKIDTGNEDLRVNWDNTFRYNLGYRVGSQDKAILANPNLDDGDRNFANGFVANRLDVLSELDATFKKDFGFRVSWAGWYDQAYAKDSFDNNSVATSNYIKNGQQALGVNDYVKYYYAGPNGEILDAFGFGRFSIADIPVQVKVGRHTLYFGESLGLTAGLNSIAYMQSPLDVSKAYAVPGTGLKELFRPLNNVSLSVAPIKGLSITGQYFLQWEPSRFPEAGSYLGIYDFFLNGSQSILDPGLGVILRGNDINPPEAIDWGIATRWSPDWLDGTVGLYYRYLSDKLPQAFLNLNPVVDGSPAQFNFAYPARIGLYGLSLSKQILGLSVGAELSYRTNMPLVSDTVVVASDSTAAALGLPPGSYVTALPNSGDSSAARGDTFHGVLNFLGLINKTPLFDTAAWTAELSWNHWVRVTQNEAVFRGRPDYNGIDRVSKDAIGIDLTFIPTWFQVFPSVDLLMPLTFGVGLSGNASTVAGINKDAGYYSVGLAADIMSRYRIDLTYFGYFGNNTTDPTGAVTLNNGDYALLKDRGTLALTFRATF